MPRPRSQGAGRNGMPEPIGYRHNAAGRAREAEITAELAAIRAQLARKLGHSEDTGETLITLAAMQRAGLTEHEQYVINALDGAWGERMTHLQIADALQIAPYRVPVLARKARRKLEQATRNDS